VDENVRDQMRKKQVIDYVIKRAMNEIEHVAHVVNRLCENKKIKVLVVDDSSSFRAYLMNLLQRYGYQVYVADSGQKALSKIEQHPDISLIITDYHMPDMDGHALIQEVRKTYRRAELSIIGVSSTTDGGLTAKILKSGANDFINKPFEEEEFFCRVTQNTNLISYVRQVRDMAIRDFLTGLYNRRYLLQEGQSLYVGAQRGDFTIAVALLDADHFKRVNDEFGHQAGDEALIALAGALKATLPEMALAARYGGEEFACVAVVDSDDEAFRLFERVRQAIQDIELVVDGTRIPITASIGVTTSLESDLESMLARADEAVYRAKEAGRNRVEIG
jgi:diguanylate cyclase (GGDEF)-like protein